MGRTARRCRRFRSRCARFELLEPRQYLSANQALTTDLDVQQMPSVAVDSTDENHVVVAYMDYSLFDVADNPDTTDVDETYDHPYAGIGVAVSYDGGEHWEKTALTLPEDFAQGAANPIVKFDTVDHDPNQAGVQNRVYISYMAATFLDAQPPITNPSGPQLGTAYRSFGMSANNGIFVSASDNGGIEWKDPVAIASHLFDGQRRVPFDIMPDLAVDTYRFMPDGATANPNFGNLYAVWSRYYPMGQYPGEPEGRTGSNIMFAISSDGGANWQLRLESRPEESADPITVIYNKGYFSADFAEGVGLENWSHVTVGPEGDIYVSHFLGGQFAVHHSTNAGVSFAHPDPKSNALFPFGANFPAIPGPLSSNSFRLQTVRAIVADPLRPGYVYVAETNPAKDPQGNTRDEDEIIFARSTDYGQTWQKTFTVGTNARANVINDENDGTSPTGSADDVAAGQVLPRLVADADGNLVVIWYDTRHDPLDHRLDVFGAISTDGGATFSPNFRISDASFDADEGAFTDGRGNPTRYLGDFLGLALGNRMAYAVWADTRNGNQDIAFARFLVNPPPLPLNDRYEDNDTRETATDLERVVERDLPKLTMVQGEEDWFKLETASTGTLSVSATLAAAGPNVIIELYSMTDGNLQLVKTGDVDGLATSFSLSTGADETYWVRIRSGDEAAANSSVRYTLSIKSLTDNLGTRAYGKAQDERLEVGDKLYYALTAAAAGSFRVALARNAGFGGEARLQLLDSKTLEEIAVGATVGQELVANLSVARGQKVYVRVVGDENAQGSFDLSFTNLDQFTIEDISSVFYPTGIGPSETAIADLNGDGALDIVVSHVGQNIISVLVNNGNGTYQSPREFAIGAFQQGGPFTIQGIQNFHRDLAIANFNPDVDDFLDVVVVNTSSSDISVLLGNGDGTFQPQRRFDATGAPYALAVGDLNNDEIPDVTVIDSTADATAQGAVLLGRGDGTFHLPKTFSLPDREPNRTNTILILDINNDGNNDLVERDFISGTSIFLGNGDGTFQLNSSSILGGTGPGLELADLDGDGDLDLVTTQNNASNVVYKLRNADGTFEEEPTSVFVGQFPVAVKVADLASISEDGTVVVGTPDGRPDLIVANNGYTLPTLSGPAEVVILPGLIDEQGNFAGFDRPLKDPVQLAPLKGPLDLKVVDIDGKSPTGVDLPDEDLLDVVVLDRDGILILFGEPPVISPNESLAAARDLGTVVHMIQPTLSLVPGHSHDYYKLTVPIEAFTDAGNQVLDFSGGFANEEGAGLKMEVLDAAGNILASGERIRLVAEQGEELFVHVFAAGEDAGGAYTLVINTLPQVAAVEAHSLLPGVGELPGGPTTSLVLVFQGDRLNVASAENKENYTVLWLGTDGVRGGGDDREIDIGEGLPATSKAVLYNPSRNNVDAASGRSIPTALRQTVTLLFASALPAGNYVVEVSGDVMSASFNVEESSLLTSAAGVHGHALVSIVSGQISEGLSQERQNLVRTAGTLGDLSVLEEGTSFLTQSHNDLGFLLDSLLTSLGDDSAITDQLIQQIIAIVLPGLLGANGLPIVPLAVVPVDPTSIGLVAPDGASLTYDLRTNTLTNNLPLTFVEVGGNLELIVIANPVGDYELSLADVPARARAGVVYFGRQGAQFDTFTDELRAKTLSTRFVADGFSLNVRYAAAVGGRFAAPSVVQFVVPAVLPRAVSTFLVTAPTRFAAVNPSLLLSVADRSAAFASNNGLLSSFGSGGSPARMVFRAAEEVWDLVFSSWDRFQQLLGDGPLEEVDLDDDAENAANDQGSATLEQVWESFTNVIDEILSNSPQGADELDTGHPHTSRKMEANPDDNQAGTNDAPPPVDTQTSEPSPPELQPSANKEAAKSAAAPHQIAEGSIAAESSQEGQSHVTAA